MIKQITQEKKFSPLTPNARSKETLRLLIEIVEFSKLGCEEAQNEFAGIYHEVNKAASTENCFRFLR